jgi:hypothetical protein
LLNRSITQLIDNDSNIAIAMAKSLRLTKNDDTVLSQIFNPESAPSPAILVDLTMAADPHVTDEHIELAETALKEPRGSIRREEVLHEAYRGLTDLIDAYPFYASARNNRAQLVRLQYGEPVLVSDNTAISPSQVASSILSAFSDLSIAISLLSPSLLKAAVSPSQCRTLAQAHTQRGALYLATSKALCSQSNTLANAPHLKALITEQSSWTRQDFEEAASKDFFMGGRYGNNIAKVLAVHTNPTAKMCGQMVQEAMKREYSTLHSSTSHSQ